MSLTVEKHPSLRTRALEGRGHQIFYFLSLFHKLEIYPNWIRVNFLLPCALGIEGASLVAQMVKYLPAMQETWLWSLGREDPLKKGMATYSSILAWRIPWTKELGRLQSMGSEVDTTEQVSTELWELDNNHCFYIHTYYVLDTYYALCTPLAHWVLERS